MPLQWTPQDHQQLWASLGTVEQMALMALHRNVISFPEVQRELARRQPPLVADTLDRLTPRGLALADWAMKTGRWIS